jgi:hypothetical protein
VARGVDFLLEPLKEKERKKEKRKKRKKKREKRGKKLVSPFEFGVLIFLFFFLFFPSTLSSRHGDPARRRRSPGELAVDKIVFPRGVGKRGGERGPHAKEGVRLKAVLVLAKERGDPRALGRGDLDLLRERLERVGGIGGKRKHHGLEGVVVADSKNDKEKL